MPLTTYTAGEVLTATSLNANFAFAAGKILQIVRATDTTNRTTTSTSFVDADLSVTITPELDTSSILVIATGVFRTSRTSSGIMTGALQLTDNSNNALSGAEGYVAGVRQFTIVAAQTALFSQAYTIVGRDTPATISATTYKLRFLSEDASTTSTIRNADATGQLFALEVSA